MKKLGIGVMGCASIARRLVIPAIQALPEAYRLVGIGSRSQEKADEFANQFGTRGIAGYENLLDHPGIDVIYMPLPTGLHEEWIGKCLWAGKHVLVEKSLAMDFESAGRLVESARSKRLVMMEDFMFKYHSQHQIAWKLLREKGLGDLRLFRSQFGFPPLEKGNFRYDLQAGGGALLDSGAYTVKASQWFLGAGLEVLGAVMYEEATSCELRAASQTIGRKEDTASEGVDILGDAMLMSRDGVVAQVSWGFDNFYQCNYEFWGSKGRLYAERAFTPKPGEQPTLVWERPGGREVIQAEADNHFINILKAFHQEVLHTENGGTGGNEGLLDEILDQSRVLTEIRKKATRIQMHQP